MALKHVLNGFVFAGTVGDNVRYGPSLQGKNLSEAAVEGLLAFADLDVSFAKKSVVGLSVGQAQRVALARTLANEPEVCPFASLLTHMCILFEIMI